MRNEERLATYRACAAEIRTEAAGLADSDGKQGLLEIAARYDLLAKRIENKKDAPPISK